jgi:hypothetical protein
VRQSMRAPVNLSGATVIRVASFVLLPLMYVHIVVTSEEGRRPRRRTLTFWLSCAR